MSVLEVSNDDLAVLNNFPLAAVIVRDEKILWHSKQFAKIFSYEEDLTSQRIINFQSTKFQEIQTKIGMKREVGEEVPSLYQSTWINKDGNSIKVLINGYTVKYENKLAAFGIILNLSRIEEGQTYLDFELHALKNQLKLDHLKNLTSGLSHNINNQLMGISGFLSLLQLGLPDDDIDKLLPEAIEAVDKLDNLTDFLKLIDRGVHAGIQIIQLSEFKRQISAKFDQLVFNNFPPELPNYSIYIGMDNFLIFCELFITFRNIYLDTQLPIQITLNPDIDFTTTDDLIDIIDVSIKEGSNSILAFKVVNGVVDPLSFIQRLLPFNFELDFEDGTLLTNMVTLLKLSGIGLKVRFNPHCTFYLTIPSEPHEN